VHLKHWHRLIHEEIYTIWIFFWRAGINLRNTTFLLNQQSQGAQWCIIAFLTVVNTAVLGCCLHDRRAFGSLAHCCIFNTWHHQEAWQLIDSSQSPYHEASLTWYKLTSSTLRGHSKKMKYLFVLYQLNV
jgi:hypothetical protein